MLSATQVRADTDGHEERGSGEKWADSEYTFGKELTVPATVLINNMVVPFICISDLAHVKSEPLLFLKAVLPKFYLFQ